MVLCDRYISDCPWCLFICQHINSLPHCQEGVAGSRLKENIQFPASASERVLAMGEVYGIGGFPYGVGVLDHTHIAVQLPGVYLIGS